ncbi:MAG: hypothetical protein ACREOI_35035 [bacterium]
MNFKFVSSLLRIVALAMIALPLLSCSPDSPLGILFDPPKCEVTGLEAKDKTPGNFARMEITVANTGDGATAYNVRFFIKLKKGNTIIDSDGTSFGTLKAGEAALGEVWFSRIETHSEYDNAESKLYWYDAEGGYYEK